MSKTTILLNTYTGAGSQFFNHPANSAVLFNGKLLFSTHAGVFESSGDNDGYTTEGEEEVPIPIPAHVVLPISDFGFNGKKSPRSLLLEGRIDGQLVVEVTDEAKKVLGYTTPVLASETGVKLALSTFHRGRYFRFKISNLDGADFSLDAADLVFIAGPERRV